MSHIARAKTPPLSQLLPTREASRYSGLSVRSLHRKAFEGLLTKYYVGSRLRWHVAELDALVARRGNA
jgi:hypothetical protein